jgi:putative transposase
MKKSRFTDSQIIAVLKQAESGTPVSDLCRQHGISSAKSVQTLVGVVPQ